jgi:hypothetical protein
VQAYSGVMLGFVVPLTVVTLVVVMIRRPHRQRISMTAPIVQRLRQTAAALSDEHVWHTLAQATGYGSCCF